MSKLSLKTLIREVPKEHRGFPLDARLRVLAAETIDADGDGRRVLRFLSEYSQFAKLLQRNAFPKRPSEIRRTNSIELADQFAAIEYTALALLPYTAELSAFEALRESWLPTDAEAPVDQLFAIERAHGYSNWLAGQLVGNLPPQSPLQVKLVEAIRNDESLVLTSLYIKERYALSCYSLGAWDIPFYIKSKGYPDPLAAFLILSLDPLPTASPEQIRQALMVVLGLPVIDRWMMLLRSTQSILVYQTQVAVERLAGLKALGRLLSSVTSVEGANVASLLHGIAPSAELLPSVIDGMLNSVVAPAIEQVSPSPLRFLIKLISGTADASTAAGNLAFLDRHALASSGTRLGGILAAATRQMSALSERRARDAMLWLSLSAHHSVQKSVPCGNLARIVRLGQVPEANRQRYGFAADACLAGEYDQVIGLLAEDSLLSDSERALFVDALLASGRSEDVVRQVAAMVTAELASLTRLPYNEVESAVPDVAATSVLDAVNRGIVADACTRHGSSTSLTKRNDSLEDVLFLTGEGRPSALVPKLRSAGLSQEAINTFLHRVCVPAVMDTVPVGSSTEELLAERISVLAVLAGADPTNAETYELESRTIAMVIATRKEMATVDHRRVYVDIEGLASRLTVHLAPDFERYRRLARLDPRVQEAAALRKFVSDAFPDLTMVDLTELSRALTSETDGILLKMVTTIRDDFANGRDFGLDGYLSGGIRHGNLEALLREPFVKLNMLGTFWSSDAFKPPAAAEVFGHSPEVVRAFERFAREFQGIVDEVVTGWVRVNLDLTGAKDESLALFDLSLSSSDVRVVQARVHECHDTTAFVDAVIGYLLDRVDVCLEAARERVSRDLRLRLQQAHEHLESELLGVVGTHVRALVDNLISPARGGVDAALEKLANWFRRASSDESGTVAFAVPIEVSASLMRYMHPNTQFEWNVDIEDDGARLSRRCVKPWVDIIHTLLMNAVRHGAGGDGCQMRIRHRVVGDDLVLEVTNVLGPGASVDQVDKGLSDALKRLSEPDALAATAGEGRTGLVKVLKWARVDLRCPGARLAAHREGSQVLVSLVLPLPVSGLVMP